MNERFDPRVEAEKRLYEQRVDAWLDHNNPKNIEDNELYQALGQVGSWMPSIDTVLPDENGVIKHNDDLYADMSIEQLINLSADAEVRNDKTTQMIFDEYIVNKITSANLNDDNENEGAGLTDEDVNYLVKALRTKLIEESLSNNDNKDDATAKSTSTLDIATSSKPPAIMAPKTDTQKLPSPLPPPPKVTPPPPPSPSPNTSWPAPTPASVTNPNTTTHEGKGNRSVVALYDQNEETDSESDNIDPFKNVPGTERLEGPVENPTINKRKKTAEAKNPNKGKGGNPTIDPRIPISKDFDPWGTPKGSGVLAGTGPDIKTNPDNPENNSPKKMAHRDKIKAKQKRTQEKREQKAAKRIAAKQQAPKAKKGLLSRTKRLAQPLYTTKVKQTSPPPSAGDGRQEATTAAENVTPPVQKGTRDKGSLGLPRTVSGPAMEAIAGGTVVNGPPIKSEQPSVPTVDQVQWANDDDSEPKKKRKFRRRKNS